ncbi:MAG TPA: MFS transporter [Firmicutes bacterium]|nr:MFS transporter [Bacillota bacterium]
MSEVPFHGITSSQVQSGAPPRPAGESPGGSELTGGGEAYEAGVSRWRTLASILAATVLGPIDASVVNIALPTLAATFRADMATIGWVSMAYLLMISSLLLLFGRLGDMIGYKRVLLTGIGVFTSASLFCGAAGNVYMLIGFRALQAVGAGMFMAVAPAIITATFPATERGRALGLNAMTVAAGLAFGPSLGGFLVNHVGWRSIFYINLPVGIASIILCNAFVPSPGPAPEPLARRPHKRPYEPVPAQRGQTGYDRVQRFDVPGAALAFTGLISLLLFVSRGQTWGWTSTASAITGITACVSAVAFIWVESHVAEPMLDLTLFRSRTFFFANLASLMNYMAQYIVVFLTPFFLQEQLLMSPGRAGLLMSASPLVVLWVAPLSGALSDRFGTSWPAFVGASVSAISLALLSVVGATGIRITTAGMTAGGVSLAPAVHVHPHDIAWRLALFGLGTGIFQSPNNSAVMGAAPRQRLGIASGILAMTRNVGMVLGVATASAVFSNRQEIYLEKLRRLGYSLNEAKASAFVAGLRDAYAVGAILLILAAVASVIRGRVRS